MWKSGSISAPSSVVCSRVRLGSTSSSPFSDEIQSLPWVYLVASIKTRLSENLNHSKRNIVEKLHEVWNGNSATAECLLFRGVNF